jgi:hypothetical protein
MLQMKEYNQEILSNETIFYIDDSEKPVVIC